MEFRNYFMPYCIQRIKDGRYIVLNRQYKPLGTFSGEWVDYDTHPSACRLQISSSTAGMLSWDGSEALDRIILFNDGEIDVTSEDHWKIYSRKLRKLMHLKIS